MRLKRVPVLLLCLLASLHIFAATFSTGGPTSNNNDDTCDIGLFPAATLLLPRFEIDIDDATGQGETTVFSITNVTPTEQIALVTLWTDGAYPVVWFNVYLTGYDTQSINLYDVIAQGQIAPPRGTGVNSSPIGDFSQSNPDRDTTNCRELPRQMPPAYRELMRDAFTKGRAPAFAGSPACNTVGRVQQNRHAVGYATIDVVSRCTVLGPAQPEYYTNAIAFDNVLMGDYVQVNRATHAAEASPMVHIRAIPEGGNAATRAAVPDQYRSNFPTTFYGRFTGASKRDGRQPLPTRFATRWLQGGTGQFQTELTVWREPLTRANDSCEDYGRNTVQRATEYVVFDEEENAIGDTYSGGIDGDFPFAHVVLAATNAIGFRDSELPEFPDSSAVAGWVYLNLDDPRDELTGYAPRQGWVTSSLRAEGRYSINIDAIAMGNGCSPNTGFTEIGGNGAPLRPSPNVNP